MDTLYKIVVGMLPECKTFLASNILLRSGDNNPPYFFFEGLFNGTIQTAILHVEQVTRVIDTSYSREFRNISATHELYLSISLCHVQSNLRRSRLRVRKDIVRYTYIALKRFLQWFKIRVFTRLCVFQPFLVFLVHTRKVVQLDIIFCVCAKLDLQGQVGLGDY